MTAHTFAAKGPTIGTIFLVCNAEGCDRRFTIHSFGTAKTRLSAEVRAGWRVGTREDRRDFCPEHKAAAVSV